MSTISTPALRRAQPERRNHSSDETRMSLKDPASAWVVILSASLSLMRRMVTAALGTSTRRNAHAARRILQHCVAKANAITAPLDGGRRMSTTAAPDPGPDSRPRSLSLPLRSLSALRSAAHWPTVSQRHARTPARPTRTSTRSTAPRTTLKRLSASCKTLSMMTRTPCRLIRTSWSVANLATHPGRCTLSSRTELELTANRRLSPCSLPSVVVYSTSTEQ